MPPRNLQKRTRHYGSWLRLPCWASVTGTCTCSWGNLTHGGLVEGSMTAASGQTPANGFLFNMSLAQLLTFALLVILCHATQHTTMCTCMGHGRLAFVAFVASPSSRGSFWIPTEKQKLWQGSVFEPGSWGRKCAKCCVFPEFCGFAGWESQLLRTGGCGGSVAQDAAKFAPRLRARTIWNSKSLKTDGVGALLEVEVAKICTTPARENDLEFKIVKN